MQPDETIVVDATQPGERLDNYLHARFPQVSRGALQRLIDSGQIRLNDRHAKPSSRPHPGDLIQVHWPAPRPLETKPEKMELEVLHEDEDLLVVNKPAGLVVHPAAGHDEHTLVNALLHHCQGSLSGIGGVARPGIVHRLDKETSGCLAVAKNDRAHLSLAAQFAGRTVEKIYVAVVCGHVRPAQGEINAAIARHPTHRKRMAVTDGSGRGREARTSYRVLDWLAWATYVEAILHTGRTHQIRVHFHHLGHPLVGDGTYGKRQNKRLVELAGYQPSRQMLHARALSFMHPTQERRLALEAPLPEDFQTALGRLRGAQPGAEMENDEFR